MLRRLSIIVILLIFLSASYTQAKILPAKKISAYDVAKSHILQNVRQISSNPNLENVDLDMLSTLSSDIHRNRYYQPKYARFTSKDPIGFNGGYNMYGYVGNNPMKYTDSMGLYQNVLVGDDSNSTTRGLANYYTKGFGGWFSSRPRVHLGSHYSDIIRFFDVLWLESTGGSEPIRKLVFVAHGNKSGLALQNYPIPKSFLTAGSISSISSHFRNNCRNPKDMFSNEAWVTMMSCSVGLGAMPGAFARTFLKRGFVTATTFDMDRFYQIFFSSRTVTLRADWWLRFFSDGTVIQSGSGKRFY